MSSQMQFLIDGIQRNAPREWKGLKVLASFDNEATEANITTELFSFVNDAAKSIIKYIDDGRSGTGVGIYEGMPFEITASDAQAVITAFKGYLDLTDNFVESSPVDCKARIKEDNGLISFSERAEPITYSWLYSTGVITNADFVNVQYVVEDTDPKAILKLIVVNALTFLMVKELAVSVRQLSLDIKDVVATIAGGLSGAVAAVAEAIAQVLIQAVYTAIIAIQVINLIKETVNTLISPVRDHKAMTWRKLLEKGAEGLGYKFNSPILDLDDVVLLPSKPSKDKPVEFGFPRPEDFGYTVGEIYEVAMNMFDAKITIDKTTDTVEFRWIDDPFWIRQSTWKLPPTIEEVEVKRYNTVELKANRLIQFNTDVTDDWTIENFKGVNYEVITRPITFNNDKRILMKGLDRVAIPYALATRKDQLRPLEVAVKGLASAADRLLNFVGGNSNLAGTVQNRVGMMKQSQDIHNVAKVMRINPNGSLPANHRQTWSAKYLYENYHIEKSFVANNFKRQRRMYETLKVKFTFADFVTLIKNSYFTTHDGKNGKVIQIDWDFAGDYADLDFWVEEVHSTNLREEFIEAE